MPSMRTMEPAAIFPSVQLGDEAKLMAVHLALQYINELPRTCEVKEPLWSRTNDGREFLNVVEYYNGMFPLENPSNEHLRTEASRGSTIVLMNSKDLVDTFCNAISFHA